MFTAYRHINPLNAELNPICHLLALLGGATIVVVSRLRVKHVKVKVKQARCDLEGSRRFRLPDFHDIRHMKVVRWLTSRTGPFYPQECSWYSFSLGAESTPGPWCGRKEICH